MIKIVYFIFPLPVLEKRKRCVSAFFNKKKHTVADLTVDYMFVQHVPFLHFIVNCPVVVRLVQDGEDQRPPDVQEVRTPHTTRAGLLQKGQLHQV